MSIFNFIKDVGQKLLGTEHAAADTNSASNEAGNIEQKLQQYIESLNLGIQNPKVTVQGDKATVEGSAADQAALEKAIIAVGNTAGIAQVDSKIQTSNAQEPKFYTVKKGDTLSKIAKETLGDAAKYDDIFKANQPLIKNADAIYPGQQLRIPQEKKAA